MARLLRVLRLFWTTSLASQSEYGANFVIDLLAVLANLVGSLVLLSLFYGQGQDLGGWSWPSAMVVLAFYTLLDGLASSVLQPNLSTIVTHVQEGTLDFVLLKPVDAQLWLSLRSLSPAGLPQMLGGVGLLVAALVAVGVWPGPGTLVLTAVLLAAAALILYALWFLLATTSIWFVKTWNATEVLRAGLTAGRYPISAYPAGLRRLFTLVLPVAFLTTVPAEAILGRAHPTRALAALAMATVLLLVCRWFWRFALRFYTSASS
ncbi:MAG: ABC-2 family transporter protein [Cyanobacteriota bacterium]|nr:ABC-2 family transporter protein [Cyanobacteriota bacterium]